MKYVVLQTGGKQYKVTEGSTIDVEKIEAEPMSSVKFDQILLLAQDGDVQIGKPNLEGVSVTGQVIEQKKGEKIRVAKFKAKARYRKVTGHRQLLTTVKIEKISNVNSAKKESKPKSKTL